MKYIITSIIISIFSVFSTAQTLKLYEVYDTSVYNVQIVYRHNGSLYFTALNKTNGRMVLFKSNHGMIYW